MPGSSNANNGSFIPKRGPAKRRKPRGKNQIFIFSIITYSVLFASLIAAGGTWLYKNYLKSQLQTEVAALNTAITTFSTESLIRVSDFDVTLKRATARLENTGSITAILDAVDAATVGPVEITSLTIERNEDSDYLLSGSLLTETFDAAMFQRKVYNANRKLFNGVSIEEVDVSGVFDDEDPENVSESGASLAREIAFEAIITVPLAEVLFDPAKARNQDAAEGVEPDVPEEVAATTTDNQAETI